MQTTIDRKNRQESRRKILQNLSSIVTAIDDLDRVAAATGNHLLLHDRFFFQHAANLQEDDSYGTADELNSLYLDTSQFLGRLRQARAHLDAASALVHFYDYASNPVFSEYAMQEAKNQ